MTTYAQYIRGKSIRTGCEWRLRFRIRSSAYEMFPETAKFVAQIRKDNASGELLGTLKSETGTILRADKDTLELVIPDSMSVKWNCDKAVLDIVRVDLTQKQHLGFSLEIPIIRSVTRL